MWFALKKYIMSKNSHGKNELLNKMMEEEIKANEEYLIIRNKDGNENITYLKGEL